MDDDDLDLGELDLGPDELGPDLEPSPSDEKPPSQPPSQPQVVKEKQAMGRVPAKKLEPTPEKKKVDKSASRSQPRKMQKPEQHTDMETQENSKAEEPPEEPLDAEAQERQLLYLERLRRKEAEILQRNAMELSARDSKLLSATAKMYSPRMMKRKVVAASPNPKPIPQKVIAEAFAFPGSAPNLIPYGGGWKGGKRKGDLSIPFISMLRSVVAGDAFSAVKKKPTRHHMGQTGKPKRYTSTLAYWQDPANQASPQCLLQQDDAASPGQEEEPAISNSKNSSKKTVSPPGKGKGNRTQQVGRQKRPPRSPLPRKDSSRTSVLATKMDKNRQNEALKQQQTKEQAAQRIRSKHWDRVHSRRSANLKKKAIDLSEEKKEMTKSLEDKHSKAHSRLVDLGIRPSSPPVKARSKVAAQSRFLTPKKPPKDASSERVSERARLWSVSTSKKTAKKKRPATVSLPVLLTPVEASLYSAPSRRPNAPPKPVVVLVTGTPYAGVTTACGALSVSLASSKRRSSPFFVHLDMGLLAKKYRGRSLFSEALDPLRITLDSYSLVSSSQFLFALLVAVMREYTSRGYHYFAVEGFPKNGADVDAMEANGGLDIQGFVSLSCSQDVAKARCKTGKARDASGQDAVRKAFSFHKTHTAPVLKRVQALAEQSLNLSTEGLTSQQLRERFLSFLVSLQPKPPPRRSVTTPALVVFLHGPSCTAQAQLVVRSLNGMSKKSMTNPRSGRRMSLSCAPRVVGIHLESDDGGADVSASILQRIATAAQSRTHTLRSAGQDGLLREGMVFVVDGFPRHQDDLVQWKAAVGGCRVPSVEQGDETDESFWLPAECGYFGFNDDKNRSMRDLSTPFWGNVAEEDVLARKRMRCGHLDEEEDGPEEEEEDYEDYLLDLNHLSILLSGNGEQTLQEFHQRLVSESRRFEETVSSSTKLNIPPRVVVIREKPQEQAQADVLRAVNSAAAFVGMPAFEDGHPADQYNTPTELDVNVRIAGGRTADSESDMQNQRAREARNLRESLSAS